MDELFVEIFLQAHDQAPECLIINLDATDDPLHGHQEVRFFHGYYRSYCYLPLYIFCGDFLLCARLRQSNQDQSAGALDEIKRIVIQVRQVWPEVRIILRGDSGFSRDEMMTWCESQEKIDYVFGQAKNERLLKLLRAEMEEAKKQFEVTGIASRVFGEKRYQTLESRSCERRVVGKAEHLEKGAAATSSNAIRGIRLSLASFLLFFCIFDSPLLQILNLDPVSESVTGLTEQQSFQSIFLSFCRLMNGKSARLILNLMAPISLNNVRTYCQIWR